MSMKQLLFDESKFTKVSPDFTNKITSEMVSKGDKDKVNLFFITDFDILVIWEMLLGFQAHRD